MKRALVASFFSYKGGAGRTTSTLNTTYYLVTEVLRPTRDRPLLIVDADTESSGISYLLTKNVTGFKSADRSVQGFCVAANNNTNLFQPDNGAPMPDLFSAYSELNGKFIEVGDQFGVDPQAVLLLRSNVDYDKSSESYVDPIDKLVKLANHICKCPIIFDTPSGTQALTKASLRNSNTIICHMRPTAQFQQGTRDYLKRQLEDEDSPLAFHDIVLCPSVVPLDPVMIDGERYPEAYQKRLKEFVEEMKEIASGCTEVNIIDLMTNATPERFYRREFANDLRPYHEKAVVGIPEITRFKWREGLLSQVTDLSVEEKLACERYSYLANIIAGNAD